MNEIKRLPRKLKKVLKKINHHVGFTGRGPTAFDKPIRLKLTSGEKIKYKKYIDELAAYKWKCWRKTCIDNLGEDPEEDLFF